MRKAKELPNHLSALILVAVKDFLVVQKMPGYKLNMRVWHKYDGRRKLCHVCLAGAVMVGTLRAPKNKILNAHYFNFPTRNKLLAINNVRVGHLEDALLDLSKLNLTAHQTAAVISSRGLILKSMNDKLGRAPMHVYKQVAHKLAAVDL